MVIAWRVGIHSRPAPNANRSAARPQRSSMANLSVNVDVNVINQVDVAWLKQRYLKYFGYEIPQTQINVFTPEFLAFCLYIIQEASYLKESHE